ncbi:MAG: glycosyltransferase family 2 protein [Lachnospiraceae bacterium]|nr:glycosyltransferase family 2 protein [Lachnospiraceae bacterium]
MLDLTVLILTKNEEKNIEKCIRSFQGIARRFVIVDSFSTDRTVEIARSLGADVYQNPWVDYATQLNWGLDHTDIDTTWTMRMDADEELLPELVREMEQVLPTLEEDVKGIELRRRVIFMGRWIRHGGVYPTIMLRIFRTGFCRCEQTIMDEHMYLTEGRTVRLKHDFIDKNTKSLEWWIGKHNWYSDREVADYLDKQRQLESEDAIRPKLFGNQAERKRWLKYLLYYRTPLMRRAHWYFIYRYLIRLGFLDGKEGLAFHFLQGYWYRFLVDAKIMEQQKKEKNDEK